MISIVLFSQFTALLATSSILSTKSSSLNFAIQLALKTSKQPLLRIRIWALCPLRDSTKQFWKIDFVRWFAQHLLVHILSLSLISFTDGRMAPVDKVELSRDLIPVPLGVPLPCISTRGSRVRVVLLRLKLTIVRR